MNKLRYGLIGAGRNAERKHINGYRNLPLIDFVSVCDVNIHAAEALAEKYGISAVYSDYREMIEKENLDLVSVCTPNFLHSEICVYALNRGVNVHCEKPLAINGGEARAILDAQRQSGKKVMIGLNNRFTNEAVFAKQCIDAGMLGEIYEAKAGWIRRSGIPGRGTWFTNRQLSGGGVMIDLGVHYLDLVLFLMGMPDTAYVSGGARQTYSNTDTRNRNGYKGNPEGVFDVEDSAVGFVKLSNGASVSFEFSWASNIEQDKIYYELIGTKGGLRFENGEFKMFSEQFGVCVDLVPHLNPNVKLLSEFEHFAQCIMQDQEPLAPAEHGVYFMDIVDAFYQSVHENQAVTTYEN